ncbi:hypothetical protein [Photorhabdus laumondii]
MITSPYPTLRALLPSCALTISFPNTLLFLGWNEHTAKIIDTAEEFN